MSAASQEERDIWIQCIRDSVENNPFSKVIAEKKVAMRQKSIQMQKFPEKNFYQAQDWLKTFLSESLAVEDIPWECSKALIILKQGYQVRDIFIIFCH